MEILHPSNDTESVNLEPEVVKGKPMPEYLLISPLHPTYRRKDEEPLDEYANRMTDAGIRRVCANCRSDRPYRQVSCPKCGVAIHLFIKERTPGESGDIFHYDMLSYQPVNVTQTPSN